jgi:hypothetical protein
MIKFHLIHCKKVKTKHFLYCVSRCEHFFLNIVGHRRCWPNMEEIWHIFVKGVRHQTNNPTVSLLQYLRLS